MAWRIRDKYDVKNGINKYKGVVEWAGAEKNKGHEERRVENWLQHKSLDVFTYGWLLRGDGAGAKSALQGMGPTLNKIWWG